MAVSIDKSVVAIDQSHAVLLQVLLLDSGVLHGLAQFAKSTTLQSSKKSSWGLETSGAAPVAALLVGEREGEVGV